MGMRGSKVQEVTKEFDVGIKFPDKPNPENESKYFYWEVFTKLTVENFCIII